MNEDGQATAEEAGLTDVWPETQVQEAARLIRTVYDLQGRADLTPQELTQALEAALDAPRLRWPTGLCRRLWEFLAEVAERRRLSPAHLSRWYNLVGFCLRPGFGDPLDRFRIEQLWKLMATRRVREPERRPAPPLPEGGSRAVDHVAARLPAACNRAFNRHSTSRLRPILLPAKGKALAEAGRRRVGRNVARGRQPGTPRRQAQGGLGQALLKPLRRSPVPTYGFWSLTRLGARVLLYGPLNAVVHHQVVESWLDAILGFEPGNQSETTGVGVLSVAAGPPHRGSAPGRGRQPPSQRAGGAARSENPGRLDAQASRRYWNARVRNRVRCSGKRCPSACAWCRRASKSRRTTDFQFTRAKGEERRLPLFAPRERR